MRSEEIRWKWFGVGYLQTRLNSWDSCGGWWHASGIPVCSIEKTTHTHSPTLESVSFLLAVSSHWSTSLVRWKSPTLKRLMAMQQCLPTNYRDWTAITMCQSPALIQNDVEVWSIIYMGSYFLELNESFMTNWWRYNSVRACIWILLSCSPHAWTSLFHFQTLTALTLTTNIWPCQSNLTSYRWREAVSGGGVGWGVLVAALRTRQEKEWK